MQEECKRCGGTEFYKSGACAKCKRAYSSKYSKEHPQGRVKRELKYQSTHSEQVRVRARRWRNNAGKNSVRQSKLKYRYGINLEQFDKLLLESCGRCAVCNDVFENGREPFVDHNHMTGQVRELLCHECNMALGLLRESPEKCEAMARYLVKWR